MIRVFTVVTRFASGMIPFSPMLAARKHFCNARPGSSFPTTPNASTRAPSAAIFAATFPAPPRHSLCSTKSTTGTAASGESREAVQKKVAVQHQVAEYADALAAQSRDQSFQSRNRIGNIGGHAL